MTNDELLSWVENRFQAMCKAPEMWGGHEAVEMQALQLIEFWAVMCRPELLRNNGIVDRYSKRTGPTPYCMQQFSYQEIMTKLTEFWNDLKENV